nr:MAG TPA: hypothetical protein [Caudoviricetes sp.]
MGFLSLPLLELAPVRFWRVAFPVALCFTV